MNKLFIPFMVIVCLLFTACNKDKILPNEPMVWSYEILTPENVKCVSTYVGWVSKYSFKTNGKEGDIVMTCENFDILNPILGNSYTYDCGWATVKVEANQLNIHFPKYESEVPNAYEEITISANDRERKANTIICLSRIFKEEEQPNPDPETLPEEAKFKMIMKGFTPLMHMESPLPAPLDLVTFRITDINNHYMPVGFPKFTQYYDSIVWSAENFPHTFRIYEKNITGVVSETHLTTQWASYFFKSGSIKSYLKGYRNGEVEYKTSLNVTLYERDFLGLEWGEVVLQNPKHLTTYCHLNTDYEYQVDDIVEKDGYPFSNITPVNHKLLSNSDFLISAQNAIKTLMENNVGKGQDAKGKEKLFKCLPEKGMETELYWENKTTRMLMLHQLNSDSDESATEKYYLHIEPK
mgnify:CR=1 FL=1